MLDDLIAKIYSSKPNISLILSNISPLAGDPGFAKKRIEAIPEIVKRYNKTQKKCYLADICKDINWEEQKNIGSDTLHPTTSGYKKMADLHCKFIARIVKLEGY